MNNVDLHSTLFKLLRGNVEDIQNTNINLHSTLFKLLRIRRFKMDTFYIFTFYFI